MNRYRSIGIALVSTTGILILCIGCKNEEERRASALLCNVQQKDYVAAIDNATRLCEIGKVRGDRDFLYRSYLLHLGEALRLSGDRERARTVLTSLVLIYDCNNIAKDDTVYEAASHGLELLAKPDQEQVSKVESRKPMEGEIGTLGLLGK